MKLEQISEREIMINEIARAGSAADVSFMDSGSTAYYEDLENAYADFEQLEVAFETGNFGSLIKRQANEITERDITAIKNRILEILISNPFLRGENFHHQTGKENMRLIALGLGHGIEAVGLAALTAVFAGIAVKETLTGNKVLAVLSGLGAAFTVSSIALQVKTVRAVWAAWKLVHIIEAYDEARDFDPADYRRGLFTRFLDWVEGKTPDLIRREAERRIQDAAVKKQLKFEEQMRNLPLTFTYRDSKGIERQYPTWKLFEFD